MFLECLYTASGAATAHRRCLRRQGDCPRRLWDPLRGSRSPSKKFRVLLWDSGVERGPRFMTLGQSCKAERGPDSSLDKRDQSGLAAFWRLERALRKWQGSTPPVSSLPCYFLLTLRIGVHLCACVCVCVWTTCIAFLLCIYFVFWLKVGMKSESWKPGGWVERELWLT